MFLAGIVAVGFLGCWFFLRQIRDVLLGQSIKLLELNSTADDINSAIGPMSVSLDDLKGHRIKTEDDTGTDALS